MLNDVRIEKLTRQGIALMEEERRLTLRGEFAALEELNAKKTRFLEQIETLAEHSQKTGPLELRETRRQELETLFDIMRRRAQENQMLLRAAEAGVKTARRRVRALDEELAPLGVYGENGEPITRGGAVARAASQLY
ncbi:MAG: hypothetical protein AAFR16_13615 [Pseudomonadota bacterium]